MKAVEIKPGIYWVGAKDWTVRNFHGYKTQRGTTYNAYLIIDEKIVLIDAVKSSHFDEMMERISSIIDPSKIDLHISNHVEMDHSGALPDLLKLVPKMEVLTSINGDKGLQLHYDTSKWKMRAVNSGESIVIGKRTLSFVHIPMLHWPDSMMTYVKEDKLLFPNDAFGQHLAMDEIFDDLCPLDIVLDEAAKYYANIVLPFGAQTEKALAVLPSLEIDMVAPSHGIIWRKNIDKIIAKYHFWSKYQTKEKALIIYDSMWGSTETMAHAVKYAFEEKNIPVTIRSLKQSHISDIITDVLESKYIAIGSPTLNTGMLPTMAGMMSYIRGLRPKNKIGFTFGSYGWGAMATKEIQEMMTGLKWQLPRPAFEVKYRPSKDILEKLREEIFALLNK